MRTINSAYVEYRIGMAKFQNNTPPKYLLFCRVMLRRGYTVHLHEAKTTVSKYVYVQQGEKVFKVRFSNHGPNWRKAHDCDFVVGLTDRSRTTTSEAIAATLAFFELGEKVSFENRNVVLDEL